MYRTIQLLLCAVLVACTLQAGDDTPNSTAPGREQPAPHPYARLADSQPYYEGPGRGAEEDISSSEITIGLLVPLEGPQAAAGRALQVAAELALEEANRQEGDGGRVFRLRIGNTSAPWGQAAREIVRLVYVNDVVALVTPTDGGLAHVAEQVANKAGVPLLSLAPDSTTTQINLPWIFRCVPSNKQQAEVLVRELYARRAFTKVALVSQDTRDGHLGASALRAAVNNQGALLALEWTRASTVPDLVSLLDTLRGERVDALVLWTEPAETSKIVRHLRQAAARLDIYLSVEAAQQPFFTLAGEYADGVHILTPIEPTEPATGRQRFASEYKTRIGTAPAPAANSAYACLRLLAGAVKGVGPNRARVRDYLATDPEEVAFNPQGGLRKTWIVRRYQAR